MSVSGSVASHRQTGLHLMTVWLGVEWGGGGRRAQETECRPQHLGFQGGPGRDASASSLLGSVCQMG